VLVNLLGNAVKFTPPGGIVSLYVDESDAGLTFSVRDTGPGIPADEVKSIFTKFWSGSTGGGTGLGLWIACAIVDAHGSELRVESRPGEGTKFSFVLPFAVVDEPTSAAELRSESASPSRAS
jgi:signal transduction histidine kinase